ncbi:FAD-dependent oxidoreductase [Candidatus Omnitrophota bacterium]
MIEVEAPHIAPKVLPGQFVVVMAKEEGVKFEFLIQPTGFGGDEKWCVQKIRLLKCELGEPDSSGRRRPVPIIGSDFEAECDQAVIAVGLGANKLLTSVTPGLKTDKWGDITVDPNTMKTSIQGVYAGGDIVGGEGTVIMAKKAAAAITRLLLVS